MEESFKTAITNEGVFKMKQYEVVYKNTLYFFETVTAKDESEVRERFKNNEFEILDCDCTHSDMAIYTIEEKA